VYRPETSFLTVGEEQKMGNFIRFLREKLRAMLGLTVSYIFVA